MIMGMCVIDMHQIYRNKQKLRNRVICGQILKEDATIIKFSGVLYSDLIDPDCKITTVVQHQVTGTVNSAIKDSWVLSRK
jgi:hypothetical protein